MYKELRPVIANADSSPDAFLGDNTPDGWARNFASSKKLSFLKKLKIRIDKRYQLIRKYIKPGGKILDAGCGFGEWVSYLKEKQFDATGLDYSQTLISRLNATYPESEWIHGPIEKIPAEGATFDGIISWGVIEHNEEGPHAALSEFHRILRPGGHAIVTVPLDDALAVKASKKVFDIPGRNASRVFFCYYMTKSELQHYMRQAGFEVLDVGMHPPASLGKVLPRVYKGLDRFPKIRVLLIQVFGVLFYWKTDWYFMMYVIGRKPN